MRYVNYVYVHKLMCLQQMSMPNSIFPIITMPFTVLVASQPYVTSSSSPTLRIVNCVSVAEIWATTYSASLTGMLTLVSPVSVYHKTDG